MDFIPTPSWSRGVPMLRLSRYVSIKLVSSYYANRKLNSWLHYNVIRMAMSMTAGRKNDLIDVANHRMLQT